MELCHQSCCHLCHYKYTRNYQLLIYEVHKDYACHKIEVWNYISYSSLSDTRLESWYPIVPFRPKPDILLINITITETISSLNHKNSKKKQVTMYWYLSISYMETTAEPSQAIPFHASPHGSPPSIFQPISQEGLWNVLYIISSAWTVTKHTIIMTSTAKQ